MSIQEHKNLLVSIYGFPEVPLLIFVLIFEHNAMYTETPVLYIHHAFSQLLVSAHVIFCKFPSSFLLTFLLYVIPPKCDFKVSLTETFSRSPSVSACPILFYHSTCYIHSTHFCYSPPYLTKTCIQQIFIENLLCAQHCVDTWTLPQNYGLLNKGRVYLLSL